MIVLDSYSVIALVKGEPTASKVARLLRHQEMALTALGVAEVLDHLVRLAGVAEEEAALDVAELGLDGAIPVTPELAFRAGLLRARHFHRRHRAVSLADCVAAEAARAAGASVATSDPHLLDLCHSEATAVVPLPDSTGAVWSAG